MPGEKNDGEEVFKLLLEGAEGGIEGMARAINKISGPFGLVFYDSLNRRVWFGRDCLGRRSLLRYQESVEMEGSGGIVIASVTAGDREKGWEEVEADGVYYIDLDSSLEQMVIQRVPFLQQGALVDGTPYMSFQYPPLNRTLPSIRPPPTLTTDSIAPYELKALLQEAVRLRVQHIYTPAQSSEELDGKQRESKVGILFSGGLDCTVLARLAHDVLPPAEPIDLLNVAFDPRVLDGPTNCHYPPKNKKKKAPRGKAVDAPSEILIPEASPLPDSIDPYSLCPDRQTCISSLRQLQSSCPTRKFNLVLINVPLQETLSHRQSVIDLIYPHNTEMDLSIALAFYFASRGRGVLYRPNLDPRPQEPYTTPARILLSGLGADELFAGYGRHVTAFRKGGYKTLLDELELDVGRLGKRNLGRDDRVISQWGKEGRYPFLDEEVVKWAMERAVWEKCDFENHQKGTDLETEGTKKVLRLVARLLGMPGVAEEKKRAVQFGARTAKIPVSLGGKKIKGTKLLDDDPYQIPNTNVA